MLQAARGPMALNEVAQRLQLSKTSTFRLLTDAGVVGLPEASEWGKYSLAPGVHSVVSTQTVARLLRAGIPLMQQLSRQLRETTSLAALFDNRIEVIAVVESPQPIRMSNIVGHILPPNASSLGKVITAFQNEERREKAAAKLRHLPFHRHSITDRTDWIANTRGCASGSSRQTWRNRCRTATASAFPFSAPRATSARPLAFRSPRRGSEMAIIGNRYWQRCGLPPTRIAAELRGA